MPRSNRSRPKSAAPVEQQGLERVSLAIEPSLLHEFDRLLAVRDLGNRSEAMRDLMRRRLVEDRAADDRGQGVGTLTLIYDHAQRDLSDRLVEAGHAHHAHVLATMHVHLDAHLCLEVLALEGPAGTLRTFADQVLGLKGVLHGQLVLSSTSVSTRRRGQAHHHHGSAGSRGSSHDD
jgi:CopG family nickel-responsive transcriptional regulator